MEKKNIDWENLDFGYRQTDKRFVANYKDGAWDDLLNAYIRDIQSAKDSEEAGRHACM